MLATLNGCAPDKLSGTLMRMNPGSVGGWTAGVPIWDRPAEDTLDLTVLGPNGADRLPYPTGDLCIYVITNGASFAWLASPAPAWDGVILPPGWSPFRKLPVGFVYDPAKWGGIPDFHLSAWPDPHIRLTRSSYGAPYELYLGSSGGAWRTVNLRGFLPDPARLAEFNVEVRSGGSAGSAYLRSPGEDDTSGLLVGSSTPWSFSSQSLRVDGDRNMEWMTTGDALLILYITGYRQTEQS